MKKTMKWLSLALCVVLVLGVFAACGTKNPTDPVDTDKVYNIGICQLVQHPALDAATLGFKEKLTKLLGEDKVNIDTQNASGDTATCATIANAFVASKVDLIMANATDALQAASTATDKIPVVGTSITDYATALEIPADKWTGKTGINVTGASDLAPLDQQADMIMTLIPDAKTVGILYCSAEANSKYQVDVVKKCLEEKNIEVKEYSFADSNDVQAVTTKAVSECDALYIPTDNTAAESTDVINNIAEPAGKPIIAGEEGICKGCGVATLSIDYYDIGVAAAEQAYEILVNGKNPAEMDITFAATFTKKYDKARAEALGIEIPSDYVAIA